MKKKELDRIIQRSNKLNTIDILEDLSYYRFKERMCDQGGRGTPYLENVTCTGFMKTNPDIQIAYGKAEGLFPPEE